MILLGLGAGMALNCCCSRAMSDVEPPSEAGLASGVVNTSFMMGGALGLAILASVAARSDTLLASEDQLAAPPRAGTTPRSSSEPSSQPEQQCSAPRSFGGVGLRPQRRNAGLRTSPNRPPRRRESSHRPMSRALDESFSRPQVRPQGGQTS